MAYKFVSNEAWIKIILKVHIIQMCNFNKYAVQYTNKFDLTKIIKLLILPWWILKDTLHNMYLHLRKLILIYTKNEDLLCDPQGFADSSTKFT